MQELSESNRKLKNESTSNYKLTRNNSKFWPTKNDLSPHQVFDEIYKFSLLKKKRKSNCIDDDRSSKIDGVDSHLKKRTANRKKQIAFDILKR